MTLAKLLSFMFKFHVTLPHTVYDLTFIIYLNVARIGACLFVDRFRSVTSTASRPMPSQQQGNSFTWVEEITEGGFN